jgi:hypothetical protein
MLQSGVLIEWDHNQMKRANSSIKNGHLFGGLTDIYVKDNLPYFLPLLLVIESIFWFGDYNFW